jgi:NADH-quinone oxidoreductase subunit L
MDQNTLGSIAWLIPFFTALAFVLIVAIIATGRAQRSTALIGVAGIVASTLLGLPLFLAALRGDHGEHGPSFEPAVEWDWLPMGDGALKFGILVDPLAAAMVAMVTVVCTCIFIYATAYMEGELSAYRNEDGSVDEQTGKNRYARFFAYISLFATGMLGFVLSSNLLQALLFWEIMGLCSFLLIGFWNFKPSAAAAAKKAFMTTRVGDLFFFAGIMVLYQFFGSVDYAVMLSHEGIDKLHDAAPLVLDFHRFVLTIPMIPLAALLIFGGSVGKSAMFPLHVWLPDAMEGPTPVSALIHAATMVSAGVFLVARMYPAFSAGSPGSPGDISGPMFVVAAMGAFTALFAATIAVAQFDIKRVLAYSTISQLGFMVAALGIGAYVAAVFHLITHAFFKALLFLGSGSVIHGVEHGMHHAHDHGGDHGHATFAKSGADPHDPQDMRNMGGLRSKMPLTFLTYLAGTLALTGIPVFAGFWSKDEILSEAFHKGLDGQIGIALFVWVLLTAAAFLTAFYMSRQVFMTFMGEPASEGALHAHESPNAMTYPLIFLSIFAVVLGFVGVPEGLPFMGEALGNPFHNFVGTLSTGAHFEGLAFNWGPMIASIVTALAGWGAGWFFYGRNVDEARARDPLMRLGGLWRLLNNKYYMDEIYGVVILPDAAIHGEADVTAAHKAGAEHPGLLIRLADNVGTLNGLIDKRLVDGLVNFVARAGEWFSRVNGWVDQNVVDATVNLVAYINSELSRGLKLLQTGRVQQYLLIVFTALLFLAGSYIM